MLMPSFSSASSRKLATCHRGLQEVFRSVVEEFDCTILQGGRSREEQERAFRDGRSHLRWPFSSHNTSPSMAVDVTPYPIDFGDRERITLFAGYVLATARALNVRLRWGGDWDIDYEVRDNQFDDLLHYEMTEDPGDA